ncbi:MAG: hypothetical protein JSR58_04170 [Verrucomicrobia bacterium]|nr:hypothetical protein [Verrucomicrobiota bacterium]
MTSPSFWTNQIKKFSRDLLGFFFPPLCLYCEEKSDGKLLCAACAELLQLLNLTGRCPKCSGYCSGKCLKLCRPYKGLVAAMENVGPIRSLVREFENGKLPGLAKSLSSYLAVQWLKNDLEPPEVIVPFPRAWWEKMRRGYSPGELLAKELRRQFHVHKASIRDKHVLVVDTTLDTDRLAAFATKLQMELPKEVWGLCLFTKSTSGKPE